MFFGKTKAEKTQMLIFIWLFCYILLTIAFHFLMGGPPFLLPMLKNLFKLFLLKGSLALFIVGSLALLPVYDLKNIKSKTVGDGQHGTARFATDEERDSSYCMVRPGKELKPGFVVGVHPDGRWIIDASDQNLLLVAPPGAGKTTRVIIPTIAYNARVNAVTSGKGASLLCTDMKGELVAKCGAHLQECGYRIVSLNLRDPFKSSFFNLLNNVNRHMDRYLTANSEEDQIISFGKAERYAKILAQSIVHNIDTNVSSESGQYFNDTAQGLLTGIILLVSQYACRKEQKHILSVFSLVIELNGAADDSVPNQVQKNKLNQLLSHIDNDRIRSHVGAAMSADIRSSMNIFSSALGKLVDLIDAELEQMISSHSPELDDVDFISIPTAIFIICPDENPTRYFFGSLFLRYFLNDLISQARENPSGQLDREVLCLWDEFGNMPYIKNVDTLFTAARSSRTRICIALQSTDQLRKTYTENMANIICASCQLVLSTQLSPLDRKTAEELSKALGNRTVQSGSVSGGKNVHTTVQMISRPLMTPDELIGLRQGEFVVMKIGTRPMRTKLPYYTTYLGSWPLYQVGIHNQVIPIDKMTETDIRGLSVKTYKLTRGMFDTNKDCY